MASVAVGTRTTGVSPKLEQGAFQVDLTTTVPDLVVNFAVIVGNNTLQQQVDIVSKLRYLVQYIRQIGSPIPAADPVVHKLNPNDSSSEIVSSSGDPSPVSEDEIAVAYGATFLGAGEAGLTNLTTAFGDVLIELMQEQVLKNKTPATDTNFLP